MTAYVGDTPLADLLPRVPVNERAAFARGLLAQTYPELVEVFDRLPPAQRARSVLYLGSMLYSRELRFAQAARLSGWHPVLVCCEEPKFQPAEAFTYYKVVHDP